MGAFISIFPNQFKAPQGRTALKPAANGRYSMCKSLPYYFHLLHRSIFILLSVNCMLGHFVFL